ECIIMPTRPRSIRISATREREVGSWPNEKSRQLSPAARNGVGLSERDVIAVGEAALAPMARSYHDPSLAEPAANLFGQRDDLERFPSEWNRFDGKKACQDQYAGACSYR